MLRRVLIAASFMLLPALCEAQYRSSSFGAEQFRLRLEALWGTPSPAGTIQKGFGEEVGETVDLVSDLGVTGRRQWTFRGVLRLSDSVKLRGGHTPIDFEGSKAIERNFQFGDERFFLNTRVLSSVVGALYSADIEFDLARSEKGYGGLMLGARVFDVSSLISAPDLGQRVTQAAVAPVPVVGAVGRYNLGRRVSAEGEFAGITIGSRGTVYDMGLALRLHLSERMAASTAYRKIRFRGENDRDSGDIDVTGWSFGLELSL